MLSLKKWFQHKAKKPALSATAVLLLLQLAYLVFVVSEQRDKQLQMLHQVAENSSMGVMQRNRAALESAFQFAFTELKAEALLLCKGGAPILSLPTTGTGTCHPTSKGSLFREITIPLRGMTDHQVIAQLPSLPGIRAIYFMLLLTLIFWSAAFVIFARVQKSITRDLLEPLAAGLTHEVPMQISELEQLRIKALETSRLKANEAATEARYAQSKQVAHDIRSPLAALLAADQDLGGLPEDTRLMVRSAVNRIRDIANHLIDKNLPRNEVAGPADPPANLPANLNDARPFEDRSTVLLAAAIDPVITESRMRYRSIPAIQIHFMNTPESFGVFANVQKTELSRVISNLLNNAIEALPTSGGNVGVTVGTLEGDALIEISDNGCGIPSEILPQLGERGKTYGKPGGSGLGLYHAKSTVEFWGGSLKIRSTPKLGTTVELRLPKVQAPSWFVPELRIKHGSLIIIIDDDAAIHQLWKSRIDAFSKDHAIGQLHFTSPNELTHWVLANPDQADQAIFLVDYEFQGEKQNGLSLIENLGITTKSILVTSRFDDPELPKQCERLRIPLIPKMAVAHQKAVLIRP